MLRGREKGKCVEGRSGNELAAAGRNDTGGENVGAIGAIAERMELLGMNGDYGGEKGALDEGRAEGVRTSLLLLFCIPVHGIGRNIQQLGKVVLVEIIEGGKGK